MAKFFRMHPDDAYVGIVFTTNDYDKFKRLDGNRAVTEQRKQRIRRSVEANGQVFTVITVNEKMQVIDGQGRLEVFREMGLPVSYVVVPGLTAKECAILNAATTAWTTDDYIQMYCAQNIHAYNNLKALQERHKRASLNSIGFALGSKAFCGREGRNTTDTRTSFITRIKEGTFDASDSEFVVADKKLTYAERFLEMFTMGGRRDNLITSAVFAHDTVPDPEMLVDKWNKFSQLKSIHRPAATIADVMEMFEACYNYKTPAKDKFYLASEYDKFVKHRYSTAE